jgi:DNA-binding transcriptional regulator YhcF (GntR family)
VKEEEDEGVKIETIEITVDELKTPTREAITENYEKFETLLKLSEDSEKNSTTNRSYEEISSGKSPSSIRKTPDVVSSEQEGSMTTTKTDELISKLEKIMNDKKGAGKSTVPDQDTEQSKTDVVINKLDKILSERRSSKESVTKVSGDTSVESMPSSGSIVDESKVVVVEREEAKVEEELKPEVEEIVEEKEVAIEERPSSKTDDLIDKLDKMLTTHDDTPKPSDQPVVPVVEKDTKEEEATASHVETSKPVSEEVPSKPTQALEDPVSTPKASDLISRLDQILSEIKATKEEIGKDMEDKVKESPEKHQDIPARSVEKVEDVAMEIEQKSPESSSGMLKAL